MSSAVLIIGPSGSGKSTAIRTLDPETTYMLNVLGKPLPFKGYKKHYNVDKKNYYQTDDWTRILKCIHAVNTEKPGIKTLVIDDLQYILAGEFMRRVSERGYDKYSELANHFWQIINAVTNTREDLICILLSHNDVDHTGRSKLKTIGKLLDEKVTVEGMFTTILHSMVTDEGYRFLTQHDGIHTAKSPLDMFDRQYIPNDLKIVRDTVEQYFNEED